MIRLYIIFIIEGVLLPEQPENILLDIIMKTYLYYDPRKNIVIIRNQ